MAELKKELGLVDVFSVAAGAMISSGLFILPALAFAKAGPAVVLSYLLASILIIPSVLSKAELATAMPRAGGTYFYIERSMGSIWGVFSGLANWFSVAMKSAFAVVGVAILIEIVLQKFFSAQLHTWQLKGIAVVCCIGFAVLNTVSVKQTGRLQVLLVAVLLAILTMFVIWGGRFVEASRFEGRAEILRHDIRPNTSQRYQWKKSTSIYPKQPIRTAFAR